MHLIYVLPKRDFFLHGRRGRVAHAVGVASGLVANDVKVTVVSGSGATDAFSDCPGVTVVEVNEAGVARRWSEKVLEAIELTVGQHAQSVILVRYAVSNGFLFARWFRRHPGIVRCFEINSFAFHQYVGLPRFVRRMLLWGERMIVSSADMLYVVSDRLAADIRHARETDPHVVVLPNAAQDLGSCLSGQKENDARQIRFIYMGVLQTYYELDLIVEAFQRAREHGIDAQLHFYGDGGQYDHLRASTSGDPDIVFHGRYNLPEVVKAGVLSNRAVLLLPTKLKGRSEIVSPIKLYEYMSFGLPIIASSVPGNRSVLEEGVTAAFYRAGDARSCAGQMCTLALDADFRQSLGAAARQEFMKRHTWAVRMAEFKKQARVVGDLLEAGR